MRYVYQKQQNMNNKIQIEARETAQSVNSLPYMHEDLCVARSTCSFCNPSMREAEKSRSLELNSLPT